ncbi:MAG: class B sortase [Clostridium sp.]|nr:class B sortase [Clostridium sp.]
MKGKAGKVIFYLIPVVLVVIIIVSGTMFLKDYMEYKKAGDEYASLEALMEETESASGTGESPGDAYGYVPLHVNFEELSAVNEDFIGVIDIPALGIRYPMVASKDNEDYLHVTFEKQKNFAGCIFQDCHASKDFSDWNTFIFGHNMKNGSMFGHLKDFLKDETLCDSYPYIWIYTPSKNFKYRIFSYYTANYTSDSYDDFFGSEGYDNYIEKVRSRSRYAPKDLSEVDFGMRPQLIALSTCSGTQHVERFLVHGALVEE